MVKKHKTMFGRSKAPFKGAKKMSLRSRIKHGGNMDKYGRHYNEDMKQYEYY